MNECFEINAMSLVHEARRIITIILLLQTYFSFAMTYERTRPQLTYRAIGWALNA